MSINRVKCRDELLGVVLVWVMSLWGTSCRMENPAYEELHRLGQQDCEALPGPACEVRLDTTQSFDTSTGGATAQIQPPGSAPSSSESDLTSTAEAGASSPVETQTEPTTSQTQSAQTSTSSSATDSTGIDTLPEYALGCAEGRENCYTMKFDPEKAQFVPRGQGSIVLKNGNAGAAVKIITGASAGAFGHTWVTDGSGYGLLSSTFSTVGFKGIGLEMMVKNLSCSGSEICYFAGYEGVLTIGYSPLTSSIVCKPAGGKEIGVRVTPGAETRIACSLSEEQILLRINKGSSVEASGSAIAKDNTALTLGPWMAPTVPTSGGVAMELGWVRIWNDAAALAALTQY